MKPPRKRARAKIVVYIVSFGWSWCVKSQNGLVIAVATKTHTTKANAVRAARAFAASMFSSPMDIEVEK